MLYRFTRVIDCIPRVIFIALVMGELTPITGFFSKGFDGIIQAFALLLVLSLIVLDMVKGDFGMCVNLYQETKYINNSL